MNEERQFAWAEIMAAGKGLFHDFPIAISKTTITFNRFGIVSLDKLQWLRWKSGVGKWQRYESKIRRPTFEQLMKWPVTTPMTEHNYKSSELKELTWERRDYKQQRKARRSSRKLDSAWRSQ